MEYARYDKEDVTGSVPRSPLEAQAISLQQRHHSADHLLVSAHIDCAVTRTFDLFGKLRIQQAPGVS